MVDSLSEYLLVGSRSEYPTVLDSLSEDFYSSEWLNYGDYTSDVVCSLWLGFYYRVSYWILLNAVNISRSLS